MPRHSLPSLAVPRIAMPFHAELRNAKTYIIKHVSQAFPCHTLPSPAKPRPDLQCNAQTSLAKFIIYRIIYQALPFLA
jgi:hypothetical protein